MADGEAKAEEKNSRDRKGDPAKGKIAFRRGIRNAKSASRRDDRDAQNALRAAR